MPPGAIVRRVNKVQTDAEALAHVRARTDTVVLKFSCGKDSLAAWLVLREHFERVVPVYHYRVPDLEFVETSLRYYERFFGTPIVRLPHPLLYTYLARGVMQPPARYQALEWWGLDECSYDQMIDWHAEDAGLPAPVWRAVGTRKADSAMRRLFFSRMGQVNDRLATFYPVAELKKADLMALFRQHGVKLPVDYKVWGRSFDGYDAYFLEPMKKWFPRDYERVLEWFPFFEMELMRKEVAGGQGG
jgi:hypothetical protein